MANYYYLKGKENNLWTLSIYGQFCKIRLIISHFRLCYCYTLNYLEQTGVGIVFYLLVRLLYFLCWPIHPISLSGHIWYAFLTIIVGYSILANDIAVFVSVLSTIVILLY